MQQGKKHKNESRLDGWPTWLDIRRGGMAIVLIISPALMLGYYLPSWIKSYHIRGEAVWQLKQKGVPDEIIKPMLQMRGPTYFFKSSLLDEIQKQVPADLYEKHRRRIEPSIAAVGVSGSDYIFLVLLAFYYFVIWWFLRPYEAQGWF